MKSEYFKCCGSPDHIMRVSKEDEDDWSVYVDFQLSHFLPWYKRVYVAVKFICGVSDGVYWDSVMLNNEDCKRLKELLK